MRRKILSKVIHYLASVEMTDYGQVYNYACGLRCNWEDEVNDHYRTVSEYLTQVPKLADFTYCQECLVHPVTQEAILTYELKKG